MSSTFPILWRSPKSEFNNDEPLNASKVYTPEVLKDIKKNGFNAIWMRGKLWELGRSTAFPELNDANASDRVASLKKVIEDASDIRLKVFLYFNEPLALPKNHEFWQAHPEMAGEPHSDFDSDDISFAFCTSSPRFMELFNEAVGNLYEDLPALGGVILITTSEFHTHCWSHRSKRLVGDKYMDVGLREMECPRCRDREPADIVSELVGVWKKHADALPSPPEVWAWNWSWSMWYEQPQTEVISKLPDGVKLMCDFERGSTRRQAIGEVFIDEYSLGFVGPSARFAETYFGISDAKAADVLKAWEKFAAAFGEYPFSIPMLYHSPINYAPALPLSLHFEGKEMGPSWIEHEPWGDDMSNCLSPFSIEQVIECYSQMSRHWSAGLESFESALAESADANGADAPKHCFEELLCARMIACHMDAMLAIAEFQKWRDEKMKSLKLKPPCDIPSDEAGLAIIAKHKKAKTALSGCVKS